MEDNFSFCYRSEYMPSYISENLNQFISLEYLRLIIYSENDGSIPKSIDNLELSGAKIIQGHVEFEDETKVDFILFDGDLVSKITWNKISRSHVQNIYKIKIRSNSTALTAIVAGESYVINDAVCPSFILFFASSEVILGVLIEGSVKFWTLSCDLPPIESAAFSEELGVYYLNAWEKSGFFTVKSIGLCLLSLNN